jgi:hypothetical protein
MAVAKWQLIAKRVRSPLGSVNSKLMPSKLHMGRGQSYHNGSVPWLILAINGLFLNQAAHSLTPGKRGDNYIGSQFLFLCDPPFFR